MKKIVIILVLVCCFSCKEETKEAIVTNNVIQIDTASVVNKEDEQEKLKPKKQDERYYHITIHNFEKDKDTIVDFHFLESDEALSYTFDYEPFEKRIYTDSIRLQTKNIEVVIIKSKFDKTKSKLTYSSDSLNINKIDNHKVFGADTIPITYISALYLNLNGNYLEIDKGYYEDLYEPDFNRTEAYYYDKEIIITMGNSDGYLGYGVTFFLDNQMNMKRIIYIP